MPDDRTSCGNSLRKQVSLLVPIEDWRNLRIEAARRGVPMTELVHGWIEPQLAELRDNPETAA